MIDIARYEYVAALDLSVEERDMIRTRAGVLAEGFDLLDKIDAGNAQPLVSVADIHTILREDIARKSHTRDEIMANAPEQSGGYFQVPGTID
jgi:aspartyl-tRNA(Asn)/glutamyl-tRNA(Gln) amidotransferase subunit C